MDGKLIVNGELGGM